MVLPFWGLKWLLIFIPVFYGGNFTFTVNAVCVKAGQ